MVIIAAEALPDFEFQSTGSFQSTLAPLAIHKVISREELESRFGLYKGSGGELRNFYTSTLSGSHSIFSELENLPKGIAHVVENLRLAFSLTQEDLAEICQVQSRMTLNNWINEKTTPRKAKLNRLFDLDVVAQAWLQEGQNIDKTMLHQPVVGGDSLFDLLRRDKIDRDLILFAGSRLNFSMPAKELDDPFA